MSRLDDSQSSISKQNTGCLTTITLIFGVFQITFASSVLQQTEIVGKLAFPAQIQAGIAVLWSCAFLLTTIALVRRKTYAVRYGGWLTIAFIIYNLLRQIIFVEADYEHNRIPFFVMTTVAILAIPILLLLKKRGDHN